MWANEEKSKIIHALDEMKKLIEWAYTVTGDVEKTNRMFDEISNIRAALRQDWLRADVVLPEDPDVDSDDVDDYPAYLVTIKDASIPSVLRYMGKGVWREAARGYRYSVTAWAYLPEAYREGKK